MQACHKKHTTTTIVVLMGLVLVTMMCATARAGGKKWRWPLSAWAFRKRVKVGGSPDWASKNLAHTWVWTGPRSKSDGSDIRVTTPEGKPLPHRVVAGTPQGKFLIVFRKPEDGDTVAVYYGNSGAESVSGLNPRTGLLLETRPLPKNVDKIENWEMASKALQKSRRRHGIGYVKQAFKGFNPYGEQKNFAYIFSGYIHIPRPGPYEFGVMSKNSSFLFIDGNPVSAWTGKHDVERNRKGDHPHSGRIQLQKGVHSFRQVTFVFGERPISGAVWHKPKEKLWNLIPSKAFRTPSEGSVKLAERQGAAACAEFRPETVDYLETGAAKMVAVKMRSLSSTPRGEVSEQRWSFGDGLTDSGGSPVHVYFLPGTYRVDLQVNTTSGQNASLSRPIRVELMRSDLDFQKPVKNNFKNWTSDYNLTRLPNRFLVPARDFLKDTEQHDRLVQLSLETTRRRSVERSEICDAALFLGKHYLRRSTEAKKAFKFYRLALETAGEKTVNKYKAMLGIGNTHLLLSRAPEKALGQYKGILDQLSGLSKGQRRRLRLRIGDAHRLAGNVDKARDSYSQAASLGSSKSKSPANVARAQYIQSIQGLLGEGRTEQAEKKLDKWLDRHPKDRLLPQPLWLKSRTHLVAGNFQKALWTARSYLVYGSDPDYAPRVLLVAGEACMELKRTEKAIEYFRQIDKEYPESPVVKEARDHLDRLQN